MRLSLLLGCVCGLSLVACGDDEKEHVGPCAPESDEGCDDGQVCELVEGGEPTCFAPLTLHGRVIDLQDEQGIGGAHVVALDINGGARSNVAVSEDDGHFSISLPSTRDAEGEPLDEDVLLHVSAPGYDSFPVPPRQSLPIALTDAMVEEGALVIESAATTVGLLALVDARGTGSIRGSIDHALGAGALVVAVVGDVAVSTAIADANGDFTLFNIPDGEVEVQAYRAGLAVTPASRTGASGEAQEGLVLEAGTSGLSTVSGSVNIVNAEGGLVTSVILALESTFHEGTKRGIAPVGFRAADISNAFRIEGVPPGRYVALAAFENDELVRDPDEAIAGTDIVHLEVDGSQPEVELEQSFKVTGALAVTAPTEQDDALPVLSATEDPTFAWVDDSSEDGYELRVYDAFGRVVHEALDVARVSGGGDVSYTWSGAALEGGMIYQMRATSFRDDRASGGRTYISATEDLRGVFMAGGSSAESQE